MSNPLTTPNPSNSVLQSKWRSAGLRRILERSRDLMETSSALLEQSQVLLDRHNERWRLYLETTDQPPPASQAG